MTKLWICILLVLSINVFAVDTKYSINGGMFYHIGYGNVVLPNATANGLTMGLGGRAAIAINPWIRIGAMGFNTGFDYESFSGIDGSYVNLSFGGITAEYVLALKHIKVSYGGLVGGGSLRHLHIISSSNERKIVTFEKSSLMIASPLLLLEYPIKRTISAACMIDWVLGTKIVSGKTLGPRFHVGILFNR